MRKIVLVLYCIILGKVFGQINLVVNGSFEEFDCPDGTPPPLPLINGINAFQNECARCWYSVRTSSDILTYDGGPYYPVAFDGSLYASACYFYGNGCYPTPSSETFGTDVDIRKGKSYRLKYKVKNLINSPVIVSNVVEIGNGYYSPDNCTLAYTNHQSINTLYSTSGHPSWSNWFEINTYFTADDNYSQLIFYQVTSPYVSGDLISFYDLVELYEVCNENYIQANGIIPPRTWYYGGYVQFGGGTSLESYSATLPTDYQSSRYIEFLPNTKIGITPTNLYFNAEIRPPCTITVPNNCAEGIPIMTNNNYNSINSTNFGSFNENLINSNIENINSYNNYDYITVYSVDGRFISRLESIDYLKLDLASGVYVFHYFDKNNNLIEIVKKTIMN